jgi:signal transduction histidine kinase
VDHFSTLKRQLRATLFVASAVFGSIVVVIYWSLAELAGLPFLASLLITIGLLLMAAWLLAHWYTAMALKPLGAIWQAILHLSPTEQGVAAPQTNDLTVGRELVTSLLSQVYQLANIADKAAGEQKQLTRNLHNNFVAQNLPLPLIVMDRADNVTYANEAAAVYLGIAAEDMHGKNIYMVLDMYFPSEDTFENWLKKVKSGNATAASSWERVKLDVREERPTRMFDLTAYYNRDNPDGHETMLVMFDHTKQYSQDDQAISFIALSVHELRTPLTLLKGYIEVFEEELGKDINPELQGFMLKMRDMSDQLTAFVNNILNVARVEGNQLELKLQQSDWSRVLKSALETVSLRARVRGITLHAKIHPGLPAVGIDPISITEVLNNLIDNAIKYSGTGKVIEIETRLNREGLIETTVRDYGLGISTSILPNLFTKFYRDHRNRAQIGGTGLGLYLSKAIVTAHGGNIWVNSKEGEGSVFGFTLVPYAQLAEGRKQPADGEQAITRSAHGWIKNHSLYRR